MESIEPRSEQDQTAEDMLAMLRGGCPPPAPDAATGDNDLPTSLDPDTRDYPLEAPVGVPSPLREAFAAVARALFQATWLRDRPAAASPVFSAQAATLCAAYNRALQCYAAAECYLGDRDQCAHHQAVVATRLVNDAAGQVELRRRLGDRVSPRETRLLLLAVPAIDLRGLLSAMRQQVIRASSLMPPMRPVVEASTSSAPPVQETSLGTDTDPLDQVKQSGRRVVVAGHELTLTPNLAELLIQIIDARDSAVDNLLAHYHWERKYLETRLTNLRTRLKSQRL